MADPRFRGASIFAGTKRVADFKDNKFSILANDERVYADVPGGTAGATDGVIDVNLTASAVVPVAGMVYSFETQLVAHNYIDVGVGLVNAKIAQARARVIKAEFDTDIKTGMLVGSFELILFNLQLT